MIWFIHHNGNRWSSGLNFLMNVTHSYRKKICQYILCTVDILYTAEIVRVEVWQFAILNRAIFCVYDLRHYCYFISIHCCHCHNDSFLNRARNLERFTKRPLHWFPKCNFARNDSSFVLKCLNHWKRAISLVILQQEGLLTLCPLTFTLFMQLVLSHFVWYLTGVWHKFYQAGHVKYRNKRALLCC